MVISSKNLEFIIEIFSISYLSTWVPIYFSVCQSQDITGWEMEDTFDFLESGEERHLKTLRFERRRKSFLLGRFAAKQACSQMLEEANLSQITIHNGVFSQPVVRSISKNPIQVSISHSHEIAGAIVYPDTLIMGLDIEKYEPRNISLLEACITEREHRMVRALQMDETHFTMLWAVKESLSKALKTGLTVPYALMEISEMIHHDSYLTNYFVNFPQYSTLSFFEGDYVFAITYPKNTELQIDISKIKKNFRALMVCS